MERVLEIIRHDVAADKVRVDNPTQNLESYFLDVVQQAKRAAAETSGAQSGARVAAYLRGGVEERPASDKILERLTLPHVAPSVPGPAPQPAETVNQKKLEALARPAEPVAPSKPAPATNPAKPVSDEELRKADEKLSSLLGKQSQK
jgi:hypothetical protein